MMKPNADILPRKIVIFDLDDTLIPNAGYYNETQEALWKLFHSYFPELTKAEFMDVCKQIDIRKVSELGFSRNRFPMSYLEAYNHFCELYGKAFLIKEAQNIIVTASTVFDNIPSIKLENKVLIHKLSRDYDVFLLTAGDRLVQTYKLFSTDLYKCFQKDRILIVPEKHTSTYIELFSKYGVDNCVMIGNSCRTDINPALEAGMSAILFEAKTWAFDDVFVKESDRLFTINCLSEVPSILRAIFKKAA